MLPATSLSARAMQAWVAPTMVSIPASRLAFEDGSARDAATK